MRTKLKNELTSSRYTRIADILWMRPPKDSIMYVWIKGKIVEVNSFNYLYNPDKYYWKYALCAVKELSIPSTDYFSNLTVGGVYMHKKNLKKENKHFQFTSSLFRVEPQHIPKDFKALLFLMGIKV
jgi:hypothetical protein